MAWLNLVDCGRSGLVAESSVQLTERLWNETEWTIENKITQLNIWCEHHSIVYVASVQSLQIVWYHLMVGFLDNLFSSHRYFVWWIYSLFYHFVMWRSGQRLFSLSQMTSNIFGGILFQKTSACVFMQGGAALYVMHFMEISPLIVKILWKATTNSEWEPSRTEDGQRLF